MGGRRQLGPTDAAARGQRAPGRRRAAGRGRGAGRTGTDAVWSGAMPLPDALMQAHCGAKWSPAAPPPPNTHRTHCTHPIPPPRTLMTHTPTCAAFPMACASSSCSWAHCSCSRMSSGTWEAVPRRYRTAVQDSTGHTGLLLWHRLLPWPALPSCMCRRALAYAAGKHRPSPLGPLCRPGAVHHGQLDGPTAQPSPDPVQPPPLPVCNRLCSRPSSPSTIPARPPASRRAGSAPQA